MAAELPGDNQLRTPVYTKADSLRNHDVHTADFQTLKLEKGWRSDFPAAALIERLTHRPPATCAELARLAGFRELEAA